MADLSGKSFRAAEVAEAYIHRPPYASQVYQAITENAPATARLLDLGCGEGKVARALAPVFEQVVAVDPSANMIGLGTSLENGQAANIRWVEATAEEARIDGRFDAVTFASSIHWMDPKVLFAKLKDHLATDHILAVISGDTAFDPPWEAEWQGFLARWVPKVTGQQMGSDAWTHSRVKHLDYMDVVRTDAFVSEPFAQTIDQFILCQHSRNTFTIPALGADLGAFRQELASLLQPHADPDGQLSFRVKTDLTLATLKTV